MFNYFFIPSYSNTNQTFDLAKTPFQNLEQQESNNQVRKIQKIQKKYQSLKKKYQELQKQNQALKIEIKELEANQPQEKRKKIKRRSQTELFRDFKCPYQDCQKEYASSVALNLHIKTKHNGGTKKQRMAVVKQLIEAQLNGQSTPEISINLPPNYLQEYEKHLQQYQKAQNSKFD